MTTLLPNTRRPDVSFYANGRIDITARVAKMLSLKENDVIDIALQGGEYLLYRKYKAESLIGRHEAQCHVTKKRGLFRSNNIRAYSKRLCAAMLKAAGTHPTARLPVGINTPLGHHGTAVTIIIHPIE